jgi:hypothetical protein
MNTDIRVRRILVATAVSVLILSGLPMRGQNDTWLFDKVLERWRWEYFWDGQIAGGAYAPGRNVTIEFFQGNAAAGYCAPSLNYCAAYERVDGRLGQLLTTSTSLPPAPYQSTARSFVRIKAPNSTNWDKGPVSFFDRAMTLPVLASPECIMLKEVPKNLADLIEWLRARSQERHGLTRFIVIPTYCASDPLIYVLYEATSGDPAGVQMVRPQTGNVAWDIAGEIEELSPRFRYLEGQIKSSQAWRGIIP